MYIYDSLWTFNTILISIFVNSAVLCVQHGYPPEVDVSIATEINNGSLGESKTKLYYMNQVCVNTSRPSLIQLRGRGAIRVSPWAGDHPPSTTTCVVGAESFDYQNFGLVVTFKTLHMTSDNSTDPCGRARLDLYSGRLASPRNRISGRNGICGRQSPSADYHTVGNFLLLRFSTYHLPNLTYENFQAVITPFHTGKCQDDELSCSNGRCISDQLICDGYNNCGDDSDEKSCSSLALPQAAIIGIVIGTLAVIISIVVGVVCWKRRRDYERI